MRILQVSTCDRAGGAEKAAYTLFEVYRKRGHVSHLAVGVKLTDDADILKIPNDARRSSWVRSWRGVQKKFNQRHAPHLARVAHWAASIGEPRRWFDQHRGVEDFDFPGTASLLDLPSQRPDIVHVHNLHGGYFDLRFLVELSRHLPVFMTLPDAWLLSGHCAHSFDCERWLEGCGMCPDLTIYPAVQQDATNYNWQRKQDIYRQSRLYVATPSQWLMNKVMRSMLRPGVVGARVIPYGIDLSVFRPGNKRLARQALGLPEDAWVALFVSNQGRSNPFKDYVTMEDAIRRVASQADGQEIIFLCLGDTGGDQRIGSALIRFAGYQSDAAKVVQYYQAADVYLHAAKADTLPLVIAEALACGVPVIATSVSGIPEMIQDGVTGFLVPAGDSVTMAARIQQLVGDNMLQSSMSVQAHQSVQQRFDLQRMADSYLTWYKEVLDAKIT